MFDTIHEFFLTRRFNAEAKRQFANVKRKTERLMASRARADRAAVSQLASAVDGIRVVLATWLKSPSAPGEHSSVAFDLFLSRSMQGVAWGASEAADYLAEKADHKRKQEGLKSNEQRKADRLAQIIGTVHMAMGKSVKFIVEEESAKDIATMISELCLQGVTIEDTGEPGKSLLIVRAASETDGKGGGEGVH